MKLVLLSGGSGKRLWPLSNEARSKQFIKVLKNKDGILESMVQRVWRQLSNVNLQHSTIIATSKLQVDMIHSQLGKEVPMVVEPERRDTFPAIALAATYLYSFKDISLNEVIGILPVDSYVEDQFFERILELEEALNNSDSNLSLIGVEPTFPSEKYGYIVPKNSKSNNTFIEVSHFKEKPNKRIAEKLIKQDALWNCGVFAFKLSYILSILEAKGLPTDYRELHKHYSLLPNNSFDYEVVEKTKSIVSLSYDGFWKDLGTWNTLTDEMSLDHIGKGTLSKDTTNCHLINELDIPVIVLGIKNAVVAASPDGILVTDKESSPRIKDVIRGFEKRPMYEERRWGWYIILDYTKFNDGDEVITKKIGIKAGANLSYQMHNYRSEVWTIIKGEGEFALNGEIKTVKPGDVLVIPVKAKHGIKANTDLEIIEVQKGSPLIEEDIVRIFMTWEEVKSNCKP